MAPDANADLEVIHEDASSAVLIHQPKLQELESSFTEDTADSSELSLECVLEPRILTDFSYVENPVRCMLSSGGKYLACNGKSAVFLRKNESGSVTGDDNQTIPAEALGDEFVLVPMMDGNEGDESIFFLQNSKTKQLLCSSSNGGVYATKTRSKEGFEKWTVMEHLTAGSEHTYQLTSVLSGRILARSGHTVHTVECLDSTAQASPTNLWNLTFTSGELCYMSLPVRKQQLRCSILGDLSLSDNFMGCEAWRLCHAGRTDQNEELVRIAPWAHSNFVLSSKADGTVAAMEDRGPGDIWKVYKAPNGLEGVIIESVQHDRILKYCSMSENDPNGNAEGVFCTIPSNMLMVDEYCVWDLESLHKRTYYLATGDGKKRLEASKRAGLGLRGLPNRVQSEEWEVQLLTDTASDLNRLACGESQAGVVRLYSTARQHYLASDMSGNVALTDDSHHVDQYWVIEEREDGFLFRSHATQRVLVSMDKGGSLQTVQSGTFVRGNTRWSLEPKIPRQVNKEKLQAVGGAVAIGVIGTVATPFILGAAVGALGIAQVGIAGNIAIGSVRAVEAINTFTKITMSSSQLMIRQSSSISSSTRKKVSEEELTEDDENLSQRRYSDWRSWK